MRLTLESLKPEALGIFKNLLGSSEFGGCFCAVWTSHGDDWVARCQDQSQPNFFVTKKNVEEGRHVGYLVYQGVELVGWTGSGPKTDFPFLKTKLASRLSEFTRDIWSVGCLAIKEPFRGKGLADAIVNAVIDEAKAHGGKALEAYPTRPFHEPRVFRGTEKLYRRLGFIEVGAEKDDEYEILLMRFALTSNKSGLRGKYD